MIMEWWSGWFDHWQEDHLTRNQGAVLIHERLADYISRGVSVNLYMFHGEACSVCGCVGVCVCVWACMCVCVCECVVCGRVCGCVGV